ncbi:hypothetical protein [Sorangium sp. So ce590]|uniref:hypothetical protein n=1 Tax=unclassified Sorangium TaxID=2621164 RepID=UPI003F5E7DA7
MPVATGWFTYLWLSASSSSFVHIATESSPEQSPALRVCQMSTVAPWMGEDHLAPGATSRPLASARAAERSRPSAAAACAADLPRLAV